MNDKLIVYERLQEIVPLKMLDELSVDEVKSDCITAFEIIGYKSRDLDKVIETTWERSDALSLNDFIYDVWEVDNYG